MTTAVAALDNGLKVVTDRMEAVETVTLGVRVGVGARHEAAEVNGVSHMLEHMAFKGTGRRSARAIAEEIEAVGGYLNAYTSREATVYHATVLAGDEAVALDIIADIVLDPVFDPDELERERAVILQEIGQASDTPDDLVFDLFQEAAFAGQALGRPVLGTAGSVAAIPRRAVVDHMERSHAAPGIVAAAAGRIDHDAFVAWVAAAFARLPARGGQAPADARYTGGVRREERGLDQVHIAVGLEGFGHLDPELHALSVASTILGGGMSSRLFQHIREERGLAYEVHSFGASYVDSGTFGVYAGTSPEAAAEVAGLICGHVRGLAEGLTEAELRRARAQIKAGIVMSLESTAARFDQIARQTAIHGRPLEVAEIAARIDAVDAEAVARVSERLRAGPPTLAALGPEAGLPDPAALDFGG